MIEISRKKKDGGPNSRSCLDFSQSSVHHSILLACGDGLDEGVRLGKQLWADALEHIFEECHVAVDGSHE